MNTAEILAHLRATRDKLDIAIRELELVHGPKPTHWSQTPEGRKHMRRAMKRAWARRREQQAAEATQ